MVRSRITIRRTTEPSVIEVEVALPRRQLADIPLERFLARQEVRSLVNSIVCTAQRSMLRAKVSRVDGAPIDTNQIGRLLDELGVMLADDAAMRARAA